jgi:Xaa-Pro aminopeptidase
MKINRIACVVSLLLCAWAGRQSLAQSDVAFPREVYLERRARLAEKIGRAPLIVPGRYSIGESGLFKQDPNFWYLTGVESPYAILVMVPAGSTGMRSILFLPEQYQFAGAQYPMSDAAFRRAVWNRPRRRLSPGASAIEATGVDQTWPIDQFAERLVDLIGHAPAVYLPRDGSRLYSPPGLPAPLTLAQQFEQAVARRLPEAKLEDLTPALSRMRLIKDQYEIAALRRTAEISGQGMIEALGALRPGMNDREFAGLMEYVWKREGSPRASFAPIVASGPDAMTLFTLRGENYNSVDRRMRAGDLLFVDYGAAEYQTYTADLCRTFPVSGKFTPEQRKYYDIVLEAQNAAIAAIKPGVMMLDVIKASAQVFRKHGLEQFEDIARMGEDRVWGIMPSPTHYLRRNAGLVRYSAAGFGVRDLGHHIGIEVQDGRDYSVALQPGMVITIEPKIYIPERRIAIMIEDMILVTRDGRENLSAGTPKKADEIERIMARGAGRRRALQRRR